MLVPEPGENKEESIAGKEDGIQDNIEFEVVLRNEDCALLVIGIYRITHAVIIRPFALRLFIILIFIFRVL